MKRILSTCVIMSMICALALHQGSTQTFPDGSRLAIGTLAYIQNGDLYVRDLPNGKSLLLTHDQCNSEPSWSATGEWLSFVKERPGEIGVGVIRRDGQMAHYFRDAQSPSWSPVGDALAFDIKSNLYLVHSPDWAPHLIFSRKTTRNQSLDDFIWSPNGQWFTYTRFWAGWNREGTERSGTNAVVCRIRADGTHSRDLFRAHRHPTGANEMDVLPDAIGWTPDSKYILYWTYVYYAGSANLDGTDLYAVPVSGGKPRQITLDTDDTGEVDYNGIMSSTDQFCFSPDGRKMVLTEGGARWGTAGRRIAVVDLRNWRHKALTGKSVLAFSPAWSPDGRRIAYIAEQLKPNLNGEEDAGFESPNNRLSIMNADGSSKHSVLPGRKLMLTSLMWCADSRHLLFIGGPAGGKPKLWFVRDDGKELQALSPAITPDEHSRWHKDYALWIPSNRISLALANKD